MDLIVENASSAIWNGNRMRCAVGKGGIVTVSEKREGDKATPAGRWPLRQVLYRADRIAKPETRLLIREMTPQDAWCEIPDDSQYNQLVQTPYAGVTDRLWREDEEDDLYNIIVVLGYNDHPVVPGKGSAIFLHHARVNFSPSAGCVTLSPANLLKFLRGATADTCVDVRL